MQKGNLVVVSSDEAEMIFKGRVTDLRTSSVAHRSIERNFDTQLTIETRLFATLDIRCVDAKDGSIIWQDRNYSYHTVYRQVPDLLNPDPIVGYDNRRRALDFLAKEMSIRIHDRFLSNF
jgi:hypothetical protein